MTDKDFLGYCDLHCETPVGAFHLRDINRLRVLAGLLPVVTSQEWHRPAASDVHTLTKMARERREH